MTGKYTSKEFEATEKNITDIIFKELEDRGYRTSILEGENKHNALNYRYRTDWVISTDANSDSGEMEIWEFEIWHTMLEKNQCGAYRDEAAPEVSDGLRSLLCWDYESEKDELRSHQPGSI